MHNPHLVQRLEAIRQALLAQRSGGIGLPTAVAGGERETFLREFLQKVFPSHRRFATGAITDSHGVLTGQVDIAIEFGLVPSFPMPASEERLLLAESVAMVIEVKSDLVAQWSDLERTTERVKTIRRSMGATMTFGGGPPEGIPVVAVGYTGHRTLDGLDRRLRDTPEARRPDAALVIDSGCFVGFGIKATGPLGLYGLCLGINGVINQLGFAHPNLTAYVSGST